MALSPQTIKPASGSKRRVKRVGRGSGSGRGTYSGRGMKGQRSRSGGRRGIARRGFKSALQKVPKLRGFLSMYPKKELVTLATLERVFADGDAVTPRVLSKKGVIDKPERGVKIVATGMLTRSEERRVGKECRSR